MDLATKDKSPLLPERHVDGDLFVCDILDAAPKGDIGSMEHPIFSLSTKPDLRVRRYENNGSFIEVKPSADGMATVHDRDVLIYCISQLIAAMNQGKSMSQTVTFKAYDLLRATNRMTNGQAYDGLKMALERLAGTRVSTNVTTGGEETYENFGIIDYVKIVRETRDGRMQDVEVKLSDWVFRAIENREVLTLHRDYFRLRKPIERRMYEIARKHCGKQPRWKISLERLQLKCGSSSTLREFRRLVGNVIEEDQAHSHFPDYTVNLDDDEHVVFTNRNNIQSTSQLAMPYVPPLDSETYHDAKTIASGWDVYKLEEEWRLWITEPPFNSDKAFLGFCKRWVEQRGAHSQAESGRNG